MTIGKTRNYLIRYHVIALLLLAPPLTVSAQDPGSAMADSAFVNGKIYRVDSERTWAQAVAVRDGQFIAVGSDAEIESYIGPETVVTDLQGRMAMPGIQDLHIHPVAGALMELHECSFLQAQHCRKSQRAYNPVPRIGLPVPGYGEALLERACSALIRICTTLFSMRPRRNTRLC